MVTSLKDPPGRKRPVYRNIHVTQIKSYRLPAAAWSSILHRITGVVAFLLLPLVIWLFDKSVTSEPSFEQFTGAFAYGLGFVPGWLMKLVVFGLLWAYFIHFFVGIRHLWLDYSHALDLATGRVTALVALALGTVVAFALGAKLFVL